MEEIISLNPELLCFALRLAQAILKLSGVQGLRNDLSLSSPASPKGIACQQHLKLPPEALCFSSPPDAHHLFNQQVYVK
jgi:hypothetical protein